MPVEVQGTAQGLFTVLTAAGNVMPVLIGALLSDYPLPVSSLLPQALAASTATVPLVLN